MKMSTIYLLVFFLHVAARSSSQTITLTGKNLSMKEIFRAVEQQTGFTVWGKKDFLDKAKPVTVSVNKMPLEEFLDLVMKDQPFTYSIKDKTIILSQRPEPPKIQITYSMDSVTYYMNGILLNAANNKPLDGASVFLKGAHQGVTSTPMGMFSMSGMGERAALMISSVGYTTIEVPVSSLHGMQVNSSMPLSGGVVRKIAGNQFIFYITPVSTNMNEVVINTGVFKLNKESFTGAAAVYTGAELKTIGNKNVLESLKSLDPSFIKVENNLQGSNPNQLPSFEIRGRTSISTTNLNDQFNADPNQPLFILDGFESTLRAIYDLDMNRVASVTILKDAASTALYGAKASNGVVVVETKRPVPGKLQVSYTADLSLDIPDLGSYNLMNASEKLQFDKIAQLTPTNSDVQWDNEDRYSHYLAAVQRGVNTYWLNEPVHMGVSHRHSVQLFGGNNDLMFNAGFSYGNQDGVMKGSGRENWGSNMSITYRRGRLNITNLTTLAGSTGTESPYGAFSAFAQASPYYTKRDADGTVPKYLDSVYAKGLVNPLYNASLYSLNQTKEFSFNNNTQAIFTITPNLRLQGGLQFSKGNTTGVQFIPPDNTAFDNVEQHQKGSYTNSHTEVSSFNGNLMLTYGKAFGKHQISANTRGEIQGSNNDVTGFSAVGFPFGTDGNPAFAYSYTPYSKPTATFAKTRSMGFLANINYAWDQRFMMDVVYRLDGASVFGSSKLFKPFLSAGLGWNIGRESFIRKLGWVSLLKIRGDIGYTGNENLGRFSSISTYSFVTANNNNFGQGLIVSALGNPNLDWQKTRQESYGLDFAFLKNRVSGYIEYYHKKTDPLAVGADGTLPSSTGTNGASVINVGYLTTRGWNLNLRVSPIYNIEKRIVWSVGITGSNYTSIYGGFKDKLATLNKQEQTSNGLTRYYDGYSPDDIWAVVSRGIDPATGLDLLQKKDGSFTFVYDPSDIVKVGNTRPQAEGVISTSFSYHDFSFGANMRYRINGYVFNSALFNKVENIGGNALQYNQDRRALYDRWQKPGDIAQFTSITAPVGSPMSSRFVQKDSHLVGESFSLSWRSSAGWVRNLHLQALSFTFYLNDIFRLEKVQSERGIDYPYARTASFSVNASF